MKVKKFFITDDGGKLEIVASFIHNNKERFVLVEEGDEPWVTLKSPQRIETVTLEPEFYVLGSYVGSDLDAKSFWVGYKRYTSTASWGIDPHKAIKASDPRTLLLLRDAVWGRLAAQWLKLTAVYADGTTEVVDWSIL